MQPEQRKTGFCQYNMRSKHSGDPIINIHVINNKHDYSFSSVKVIVERNYSINSHNRRQSY